MFGRRAFQPNLADAVLEDRTLLTYDPSLPPVVLTTNGYAVFTVPLVLNAYLGTMNGAAVGGNGGNVSTAFFIYGFGANVISIGNPIGYLFKGPTAAGATITVELVIGSGANDTQGPQPVTRNVLAQGNATTAALNLLYIGPQTTTGGSRPGAAAWSGQPGSSGTLPTPAPPPVPPAPPPAPAPVTGTP